MTLVRKPLAERFWPRVNMTGGADACWVWTGFVDSQTGYGRIGRAGRQESHGKAPFYTHRVAYALANGIEDPAELEGVVRHQCDNRPCCNPAHLLIGTQKDNTQDATDRKRAHWTYAKRDSHGRFLPAGGLLLDADLHREPYE